MMKNCETENKRERERQTDRQTEILGLHRPVNCTGSSQDKRQTDRHTQRQRDKETETDRIRDNETERGL